MKLKPISIFGTSSDAGKSTISFVIAKIIQDMGYSVAPFKAQNVSNNAVVADDSSEIAVAQAFQASVLGVTSSYHINPILLKSGGGSSSSLIIEGKVLKRTEVREYYRDLDILKPIVKNSFNYLKDRYDCVVCEGAGSPVELNFMDKDLSNIYVAQEFKTKIILVADIEKGGVFASIWGVYNLLPKELRDNVIGVIINKFRGDLTLFDKGIEIIESEFNIPVLGVLPYSTFNLGFEDSLNLMNYRQSNSLDALRIAVIAYPTMSNYNDFEPLIVNSNISVEFIKSDMPLDGYDKVILAGSKLVMRDLEWLKDTGLFSRLQARDRDILGICGGYEMMFNRVIDIDGVESNRGSIVDGLGFIDDDIIFQRDKIVRSGSYKIFGDEVDGFEIHHGVSKKYPLFYEDKDKNIKGSFVHNIFADSEFKEYKKRAVNEFVAIMRDRLDINRVMEAID